MNDRWPTCAHEAGHAAAAHHFGWCIEYVEVGDDGASSGRCKVRSPVKATADQAATYAVSGAVAEVLLTGEADDVRTLSGDLKVEVLARIAGARGDAHARALAILEPRRARVWKLAHELRRCGRLYDGDVARLLGAPTRKHVLILLT